MGLSTIEELRRRDQIDDKFEQHDQTNDGFKRHDLIGDWFGWIGGWTIVALSLSLSLLFCFQFVKLYFKVI